MAAEVVQIEIPVTVQDNTDQALSRITGKLNTASRAAEKASKMMLGGKTGKSSIERAAERMDRTYGGKHQIEVTASDNATPVLSQIEDIATRVGNITSIVGINADDNATMAIHGAEDALSGFDGTDAMGSLDADDEATMKAHDADDALSAFDGSSAVGYVDVDDNATMQIADAMDAGAAFDGSHWTATLDVVNNAASNVDNAVQQGVSSGQSRISGAFAAAAGFAGLSMGAGDAMNTYAGFESGMSQVRAISGATDEEMSALTAKAKEMGATTKFTASESAEAFNYMAMAGWKSVDMIEGISGIMNLAAASGESLGSTSDIVTDALTAFGLRARDSTHFADVMAQASANANTNVGMMGESFKYVAPLAGAMGYSIEDTSLALGLMANAGVKGSMAGTSLKTAISNLASPTSKMQKAMSQYGISLTDGAGKMKSLRGVMDNMRKSLQGLTEDEQAAAVTEIFGKEAMSGMMAIINATEQDWNKLASAVDNADGASQRMADTMIDNMAGSLTLLQSAFEGVQNTFGERMSPYVREIADGLAAAMPDLSTGVNTMMDFVDGKISALKKRAMTMFNSEEWEEADMAGKINIAWDKLIAEPFTEWAGREGIHLISTGVGTLFSEAFKILPGGEEAGLTSWLSAGVLAVGAGKLIELGDGVKHVCDAISGLGTAGTLFGDFTSTLGTGIGVFFAVAAGVGALAIAIDNYNQKQINTSIADHFGDIELSASQIEELANKILETEWKVNVELALGTLNGADKCRQEAEDALKKNQAIEWLATVGVKLGDADVSEYKSNIEAELKAAEEELKSRPFAASLMVDSVLINTPEGQTLSSMISEWTLEDTIEMNNLSSELTKAVNDALEDGILEVDEQRAIHDLQSKIHNILGKWKSYESKAQFETLRDRYGNLTGDQLTGGSFRNLMSELQLQRQTNESSLQEMSTNFYSMLYAMEDAGRLKAAGLDMNTLMGQWRTAIRSEQAKELTNSIDFERVTIGNAYSDLVNKNTVENAAGAEKGVGFINDEFKSGVSGGELFNDIENQVGNMYTGSLSSDDQKALHQLYPEMKPDVQNLADYIDKAFDSEGNQLYQIPQKVMDEYTSAIELGAASGDVDAAWQLYANELAKSGDAALVQGIRDGTIAAPDELRQALQRSFAETGEDLTLEGLTATVEDCKISEESASAVQQAIEDFTDAASASGSQIETTADGIKITLGEVKVDEPSAAEQIAAALGVTVDELAANASVETIDLKAGVTITIPKDMVIMPDLKGLEATESEVVDQELFFKYHAVTEGQTLSEIAADNGLSLDQLIADNPEITNPDHIEIDQPIKIRASAAADAAEYASQVEQAAQDAVDGADTPEVEKATNITYTTGETDKSAIEGAGEELGDLPDAEQERKVNEKLVKGETDKSQMEDAGEEMEDLPDGEVNAPTNVVMIPGTFDTSQVESGALSAAETAFENPIPVNGTIDVTFARGTDNIDEVYGQVAQAARDKFANNPVSAHATVNVTLAWHITNPTASISVGMAGGSAHASISAAGFANGGYLSSAHLIEAGEDGPEYIIPVGNKRRDRGLELWKAAGRDLGIREFAEGGKLDGGVPVAVGAPLKSEPVTQEGTSQKQSNQINITMTPSFVINGDNIEDIREQIEGMIDDIAGMLAERLDETMGNVSAIA